MKKSRADKKAVKAQEILHEFRFMIKEDWVDQSWINRHDRLWIFVFNELVSQGIIEKKRLKGHLKYRWKAVMPKLY